MHILITGCQGYIGSHLTKSFLDAGHTVTTLDNCFNAKSSIFDFTTYNGRLIRHQASVANPDAVGRALQGVDVIYHLAARTDWENAPRHPLRLFETNVQGTATVLTMARKAGVDKVIFTSDAAVYGNIIGARPTDPWSESRAARNARTPPAGGGGATPAPLRSGQKNLFHTGGCSQAYPFSSSLSARPLSPEVTIFPLLRTWTKSGTIWSRSRW